MSVKKDLFRTPFLSFRNFKKTFPVTMSRKPTLNRRKAFLKKAIDAPAKPPPPPKPILDRRRAFLERALDVPARPSQTPQPVPLPAAAAPRERKPRLPDRRRAALERAMARDALRARRGGAGDDDQDGEEDELFQRVTPSNAFPEDPRGFMGLAERDRRPDGVRVLYFNTTTNMWETHRLFELQRDVRIPDDLPESIVVHIVHNVQLLASLNVVGGVRTSKWALPGTVALRGTRSGGLSLKVDFYLPLVNAVFTALSKFAQFPSRQYSLRVSYDVNNTRITFDTDAFIPFTLDDPEAYTNLKKCGAKLLAVSFVTGILALISDDPRDYLYGQANFRGQYDALRGDNEFTRTPVTTNSLTSFRFRLLAPIVAIEGIPKGPFVEDFIMHSYFNDRDAYMLLLSWFKRHKLTYVSFPTESACFWRSLTFAHSLRKMGETYSKKLGVEIRLDTLDDYEDLKQRVVSPLPSIVLQNKARAEMNRELIHANRRHATALKNSCTPVPDKVYPHELHDIFNRTWASKSKILKDTPVTILSTTVRNPVPGTFLGVRNLDTDLTIQEHTFVPPGVDPMRLRPRVYVWILGVHALPLVHIRHDRYIRMGEEELFNQVEIEPAMALPNMVATELLEAKAPTWGTWDIETFNDGDGVNGSTVPYSVQYKIYGENPKIFIGPSCFDDFIRSLSREPCGNLTMFAHNGQRFDNMFLLEWGIKRRKVFNAVPENPKVKVVFPELVVRHGVEKLVLGFKERTRAQGKRVTFQDSLPFAPGSLRDLARIYCPNDLQKGDLVYTDISGWDDVERLQEDITRYAVQDVVVLEKVVEHVAASFRMLTKDEEKGIPGFEIVDFMSMASFSKRLFYRYWHNPSGDEMRSIWRPSLQVDDYLRPFFFGGMVGCEVIGKYVAPEIAYVDFTSLYPCVMATESLPTGPVTVEGDKDNVRRIFTSDCFRGDGTRLLMTSYDLPYYFLTIKYRHTAETMVNGYPRPLFPHRGETKLVMFSYAVRWKRHVVTKRELEFLAKHKWLGMEIKVAGPLFTFGEAYRVYEPFITTYFEHKLQADRDMSKCTDEERPEVMARRSAVKALLNSSYGSNGMDDKTGDKYGLWVDRDGATLNSLRTILPLKHITVNERVDVNGERVRDIFGWYPGMMHLKERNIFHAIAITAIARLRTYTLIDTQVQAGAKVLYYDTDSAIVTTSYDQVLANMRQRYEVEGEEWMKLSLGDPTGNGDKILGGLTDELCGAKEHVFYGMGAKNYMLGKFRKFKGFNVKALFREKAYTIETRKVPNLDLPDEVIDADPTLGTVEKQVRVLVLKDDRPASYFEKYGKEPMKFTENDMIAYAEGRVDELLISTNSFKLGKTQLGQEDPMRGLQNYVSTKRLAIQYTKGKVGPLISEIVEVGGDRIACSYRDVVPWCDN